MENKYDKRVINRSIETLTAAVEKDLCTDYRPYAEIPGPKPIPVLGNTWRFIPYIGNTFFLCRSIFVIVKIIHYFRSTYFL